MPELKRGFETFTKADRDFLSFGLRNDVDLVAVSFVRKKSDIESVRRFIKRTRKNVPIIAKIEKKEAVENISEIIDTSDALMVARGDLGVENPLQLVPELQKEIIAACTAKGVPVITATQMLESMVTNPSPTRAEVTDVANAIFDGTDAVMLSEETAVGKYPTECVRMLDEIALNAEEMMRRTRKPSALEIAAHSDMLTEAVGRAAASLSNELRAKAIVAFLDSVSSLSQISRLRPSAPILAISVNEGRLRRLQIIWGVFPFRIEKWRLDVPGIAKNALLKNRFLKRGEKGTIVCLDHGAPTSHSMRMQVFET